MKTFYFSAIFLFISFCGYGQTFDLSGNVQDAQGLSIPGVNISVFETSNGAISDFDGNFTLKGVKNGDVIRFTYLGYVSQEIRVAQNQFLQVIMEDDYQSLDEVVVIGYGTQKIKEVTGAISVVSSETIDDLKPTRIEQALQGQVAGVNITAQSGSPGSAANIRIRGVSTNGNNNPLILLDGNVIEDLSVVNPGDIESLTVLKDATAGIYGVRAANGVIIITTKTGRTNTDLTYDYNSYVGFQETTRELPVLNATQYGLLANEAAAANGEPLVYPNVSGLGRGTDWQNEVFEKAPIINQDFSLRGGGEKSKYSAGFSLLTQDGIVGGSKSNFTRYTTRLNYGIELIKDLNLKTSLLYTGTTRKSLPENGLGSVLFNAVNFAPDRTVRDETGAFTSSVNHPIEVVNPVKQIENTFNRTKIDKLSGVLGVNYSFFKNFKAEVNYQWNYSEVKVKTFLPQIEYGNNSVFDRGDNGIIKTREFYRDYTFDAFLTYAKNFNDIHDVKVTLGTSVFKTTADGYGALGRNIDATTFSEARLGDADPENIDDFFENRSHRLFDSRLLSYFARFQYNYKGKYLLSAVLRRDGSTAFGPENKFGFFPSASAGWVISDEAFLEGSKTINFLKLRGSYGILGNDRIPGFRFTSLLNGEGVYVFDDELVIGQAIGAISNPEIKWEEQTTIDVGIEARLFNNHVDVSLDYFTKDTDDLLLVVESSGTLGTTAPGSGNAVANAGSVRNQGFEFQIGYNTEISEDFKISASYNVATLENEVLSVNNGLGFEQGGGFGIGQLPPSRMQVGEPIGSFFGWQTNGIFQNQAEVDAHPSQVALGAEGQPGDIRYVDVNGDGVLNDEDRTFIGDPIPDVTMGFNLSFDYKGFDFQTYIFASIGNDIARNYDRNNPITNKTIYALDRWTGSGTSNEAPRVTNGATSNIIFSDYYVEDGSFVRAQNMQLGYTFNADKMEAIGLDKLRIYASVSNVFTLTKYRGYDPTASSGAPIGGGIDNGFYPTPRTFLLGANLKF